MPTCPFCDALLGPGGGCEGCGYLPRAFEDGLTPDRPYDLMPDSIQEEKCESQQ